MNPLPTGTTPESHQRYAVVRALAESCPPALGQEIAVTGSVALGLADDYSDIELNLWTPDDALPELEARLAWLESVGASELAIEPLGAAGSVHGITFVFRGAVVEAGWWTVPAQEAALRAAIEEASTAHLIHAFVVDCAVPLRTHGALARWKVLIAEYPEALRARVIAQNTRVWGLPQVTDVRRALARRGDVLALTERLTWDAYNVLNLVYALNRRWAPDRKWLRERCEALPTKPERLAERIEALFTLPDLEQRVAERERLILDTLALLPPAPHVERARRLLGHDEQRRPA
ncbi:MAG: DUF4037 domain-containing protein [Chloroflexi bacterium]|nr:DUF4037 domain-containing protein [Chloroflexota bacterium]